MSRYRLTLYVIGVNESARLETDNMEELRLWVDQIRAGQGWIMIDTRNMGISESAVMVRASAVSCYKVEENK